MVKANKEGPRSLYQKREKLYTRVIFGRSHVYRMLTAGLIYGAFFFLPWISIDGDPVVHFDLLKRQFHILGLTFWPQDFMFLAWFLIIAAFSLFLFTTVAGRLWCGYACPQTVWTMAFIWIEHLIEGKPHQRKHLDDAPWSAKKVFKKFLKHGTWLIIAFITGFTFVAYFYTAKNLAIDIFQFEVAPAGLVWVGIFTYLTYIDAAWLREQVCIYMCPYARFQSVMYDKDTLIVSYNEEIGEPRSPIKRANENSGVCIDCNRCVQVCPTGIDIREGMQIDCLNCGLCEDACDSVMKSIGKEPNLINFTSENAHHKGKALKLFRPKVIAYSIVLFIMTSLFAYNMLNRSIIEVGVIRDRNVLYRTDTDGLTLNDYIVKISNKTDSPQTFIIEADPNDYVVVQSDTFNNDPSELVEKNVVIKALNKGKGGKNIFINIYQSDENGETLIEKFETRFIYQP